MKSAKKGKNAQFAGAKADKKPEKSANLQKRAGVWHHIDPPVRSGRPVDRMPHEMYWQRRALAAEAQLAEKIRKGKRHEAEQFEFGFGAKPLKPLKMVVKDCQCEICAEIQKRKEARADRDEHFVSATIFGSAKGFARLLEECL